MKSTKKSVRLRKNLLDMAITKKMERIPKKLFAHVVVVANQIAFDLSLKRFSSARFLSLLHTTKKRPANSLVYGNKNSDG